MPVDGAEEARAAMIKLFPGGFEERDLGRTVELAAYTDRAGEECLRAIFGSVRADEVEPGWEERWREFHRGVRVGELWVGPPWERPPSGLLAVLIDPGQAFGTGAHPTTRLCLELLAALPPTSLLDVGCGSGVLAIAAGRLGFVPVHAVDSDPRAVAATAANAEANAVAIDVVELDALEGRLPTAETTVANATLEAVTALARRIRHGPLVTSGYRATDRFELAGRRLVRTLEHDGWRADVSVPLRQ